MNIGSQVIWNTAEKKNPQNYCRIITTAMSNTFFNYVVYKSVHKNIFDFFYDLSQIYHTTKEYT